MGTVGCPACTLQLQWYAVSVRAYLCVPWGLMGHKSCGVVENRAEVGGGACLGVGVSGRVPCSKGLGVRPCRTSTR